MIVRRYVVKDMPEAVLSIRKDLGKDAVILSTKKIRVKKWLGLRWQTRLEVTAAVGGDIPLQHREPPRSPVKAATPKLEQMKEDVDVLSRDKQSTASSSNQIESMGVEHTTTPDFGSALASAFDAYQLASKSIQSKPTELADVISELASLKALVTKQYENAPPVKQTVIGIAAEAIDFLRSQGIDRAQAKRWVDEAMQTTLPAQTVSDLMDVVREVILRSVGLNANPIPVRSDSRLIAFVGPTGVGKTTTIAKIAALQVLAGQRKIGLLTTDTFRIAAIQQLQTYADILNIPLEVVDDTDNVQEALARLSHCDLILVDTAGRSFRDPATISMTDKLIKKLEPDETILVLSLTTKAEDADHLVDICKPLSIDKLLFTKLDETVSVGVIPRVIAKYGIPMSYVTTGQNVPDDIDMLSLGDLLMKWSEVAVQ